MAHKKEVLIRLPEEAQDMLKELSKKRNLSQSVLIEKLLRADHEAYQEDFKARCLIFGLKAD